MAIRIDLLPKYVAMRRWFKRILAVCLMLVSTFAAVLFVIYYREQLLLQTLKTNLANVRVLADKADAAQKAADASTSDSLPLQSNVNFLVDAGRSGTERAALLDLIRRYVYNGAVIGTVDISDGRVAKFSGMVRNPDDYARFLLNLRRGTVPVGILFSKPADGGGIQGWPNSSGTTATRQPARHLHRLPPRRQVRRKPEIRPLTPLVITFFPTTLQPPQNCAIPLSFLWHLAKPLQLQHRELPVLLHRRHRDKVRSDFNSIRGIQLKMPVKNVS